jgi:hypothetical protein
MYNYAVIDSLAEDGYREASGPVLVEDSIQDMLEDLLQA